MVSHKRKNTRLLRRLTAMLLSAALLLALLPAVGRTGAQAADWAQEYVDQMVDWGIMRGDMEGNLDSSREITRAEFVAMVNRAYGYSLMGPIPFEDVETADWFYDDICIGYNIGYFKGTGETTASPDAELTREQAAILLGRNMMLQESAGEVLGFSDSRELSDWSRGLIQAVTDAGVIGGYPDGTFRPQQSVTRGEVACMLVKSIGTPIREEGDYALGGTYGNVTISTSGVALRDTVIAGDLYLTGGIGLGDVLLENVTVLGKIVASGAGAANKGESSIILRNVEADEMVVDSISDQLVSIRAEGDTLVDSTSVRTRSYLEDMTSEGMGLAYIELDGEEGTQFELAGNIKEVLNVTPGSLVVMGQGTANQITMDERAVGSSLTIENGARVKRLNLDVAASVAGTGDIDNLTVSAAGCTVAILPDTITIRPGVIADIAGETMDSVIAAEASENPRILSGYPTVRDIAPTSAKGIYSVNKKGTVYWAVSALTDGSVSKEDLLSPPSYGSKIVSSGNLAAGESNTEYTSQLTRLTSDGSYYLTAIMVDSLGKESAVKIAAFTTPDNTVPAFASGYPQMTKTTCETAQVTIMTTKSCQCYYALLPANSAAPTVAEFKAGAVTGALGFGVVDAVKNTTIPFKVNDAYLDELTSYDLYLWLTDYDGAQSSAIQKLSFTTADETPPVVTYLEQSGSKATSVDITFSLSEPGALSWAVVKQGEDFLRGLNGGAAPSLSDSTAKLQVENGMGSVKSGSSKANAAGTNVKFTISGLEAQSAYDLYYVAKDNTGNYSAEVGKITVNTLDEQAPTVTQEFTLTSETKGNPPLADTDIRLIFSERVEGMQNVAGTKVYQEDFLNLYYAVQSAANPADEEAARDALAAALRQHIELYYVPVVGQPSKAADRAIDGDIDWIIDYRYATVALEDGKMIITFPHGTALSLGSASTYYFTLNNIVDSSASHNLMRTATLDRFTTASAQVMLAVANTYELTGSDYKYPTDYQNDGNQDENGVVRIDIAFTMTPDSTSRVDPDMKWDALLWTDTSMSYTLYSRPLGGGGAWEIEGRAESNVSGAPDGKSYRSLTRSFRTDVGEPIFDGLEDLEAREFGIHVNSIGASDDYSSWNERVTMGVTVVAGSQFGLNNLSTGSYSTNLEYGKTTYNLSSVGAPDPFEIPKSFSDSQPPVFVDNFPTIKAGDIAAELEVMIDRPGSVYYVAVPVTPTYDDTGFTELANITDITCPLLPNVLISCVPEYLQSRYVVNSKPLPSIVPTSGDDKTTGSNNPLYLTSPSVSTITAGRFTGTVRYGTITGLEANNAETVTLTALTPNTLYYLYLVTKGTADIYSEYTMCYRFHTEEATRPILRLDLSNPAVNVTVDRDSYVTYILVSDTADALNLRRLFHTVAGADTPERYMGSDYTILQALTDRAADGNSVFDAYATETAKNDMMNTILNQNPDGTSRVTMKAADQDIAANTATRVDCTPGFPTDTSGTSGVSYIFLAMARSHLGSGYAFSAISPVEPLDNEAPKVISCTVTTTTTLLDDYASARNQPYDGGITITFDETLYYRAGTGQNPIPIENTNDTKSSDGGAHYPLKSLIVPPITTESFEVINERPGEDTFTMQFKFEGLRCGETISVNNLSDKGGLSRGVLQFSLTLVKNSEGLYEPTLEFIPSTWDGRE